jgi:hypothetical protein
MAEENREKNREKFAQAIGIVVAFMVFMIVILPIICNNSAVCDDFIPHPSGKDCVNLCGQNGMVYDGYLIDDESIRDGYCRCLPMKYSSDNPGFDDRWIKWRAD